MKNLSTVARHCLMAPAIVAAFAAGSAAQAAVVQFDFDNAGFVALFDSCGAGCRDASAIGQLDGSGGRSWGYFAQAMVTNTSNAFSGTWELSDLIGDDDLSGTFVGALTSASTSAYVGSLAYTVTGGTGNFKGASGTGSSLFSVLPSYAYTEKGSFSVTPVPEPGTWAMMGIGLLGLGFAARRKKA